MTKLKSITKRTLSVLLCMVMVLSIFMSVPFTASAAVKYSFEENGIRYLELDDSTVSVVGANPETMPEDVVIPSTVQGKTVIAVGERAFENSNIKSIILPETVTAIGICAFQSTFLERATILGNITTISDSAFAYCPSLKEVNLPDSITHIGARAFWACDLVNFQLPKNLESIGESAFRYYHMEQLIIPATVHTIGDYAFDSSYYQLKNIVFEERTTPLFLGQGVFSSCTKLTSVTFPDNINITFGNKAFLGCKGLTNVIFPDNANITLGESEFSKCTNLKTVKLPNNITAIPNNTFKDCTSLESVQGGKIASIGNNAFENCTSITNYDFSYCTNIGSGAFSSCKGLTSITFPDNANVTLGESAFSSCTNLKTVTLSENMTAIPNALFKGCTSLESVQGGKITSIGNNAFENCKSITNFDFSYYTNIGDYAFAGCTGFTSITFPENIGVVLGKGVFSNCTNLKTAKLSNNINAIPAEFFLGCTSLESVQGGKITSIGSNAFKNCTSIANYDFTYCTNIGDYAFAGCTSITNYDFSYCTNISGGAFSGCTGLTSVTLPDSVVTFGEGVFQGCTNLKTVKLPDAINTIPRWCFSGCTSLESIQTGMIKYVNNWAFYDCKSLKYASFTEENIIAEIGMEAFLGCSSLTEFSLPKVKYIQNEAFKNCTSLVNVDLSKNKSLYEISQYAFYNCTSLESIDIPSSCREIWFNAFMNCESLYYVDLKSGLKEIGEKAFFNCYSLYYVVIPKSVKTIGGLAFGCFEQDGKNYSYSDFIVVGVKDSLADEYADAYDMYWALNAPKLSKIENTSSGVKITYSKPSGASSGKYEIYRCTNSTEWKLLGTTSSLSYTDKTAKSGTKYYYTVQFIGKPTNSITNNHLETIRLSTPKISKVTNTNDGAKITWGKVTGAKKYNIYVKSSSGWKKIGESTSTSFTHTSAKSGKNYTYTIKAYDSTLKYASGYDSTGYTNKFVASPKISKITNTTTGTKITWGKVSGAEKYRVFIKNGSKWVKLADTTSTSYTHTKLKSGMSYSYTVRCISSTGKSYKSGYDKTGTDNVFLSTPSISKVKNTKNGAKITWNKVTGAKKYNIYVKSSSGWKKIGESTSTSFTHTSAKSGKSYTYTVKAYDSSQKYTSAYNSTGKKHTYVAPK